MASRADRARKARAQRSKIARIFDAMESGRIGAKYVLDSPPEVLRNIRIYDVLRRLPHLDRKGAEHVCTKAHVWPLTVVGNLTEEERKRILSTLPPRVQR